VLPSSDPMCYKMGHRNRQCARLLAQSVSDICEADCLEYLIGLDLGTSSCKAMLFDATGNAVASEYATYPTHILGPLMLEQAPDDWRKQPAAA